MKLSSQFSVLHLSVGKLNANVTSAKKGLNANDNLLPLIEISCIYIILCYYGNNFVSKDTLQANALFVE